MLNEFDAVGCISHNIDIYKDAVRYYVFKPTIRGGRIGLPNTLVAEEFHTITEEELQSVLDTVRALELHQEELYEEPPSPSPDKYVNRNNYFTNRQDDFLRIKASVEQVARLTGWNCPPGTQSCSTGGGSTSVLLRYEYGAPLKK
jgi:hypothetical protein